MADPAAVAVQPTQLVQPLADAAPAQSASSGRIDSLDLLRGLAIVLMAFDHVRHFMSDSLSFAATNLAHTTAPLFLARWITHFCAPVFVVLAGTAAYLHGRRGRTRNELAAYLLTRGLLLIALELTIVRCAGWTFNLDYHYMMGGVLWALGWAMISLAGLICLPLWAVATIAIGMIISHNLLDGVTARSMGSWGWLWKVVHVPGTVELLPGYRFRVAYPLAP